MKGNKIKHLETRITKLGEYRRDNNHSNSELDEEHTKKNLRTMTCITLDTHGVTGLTNVTDLSEY